MSEALFEFLKKQVPVTPYLIGRGIFPEGSKMIIAGSPKANKSFLALNMALDLARGTPIFGAQYEDGTPVMPVQEPRRVLYIDQEVGEAGLQARFNGKDGKPGILSGEDISKLPFFIKTRDTAMRMDKEEGMDFLYDEISSVRPDIVFFDPLSKFHLADENSAQEMGGICRFQDHIRSDFKCALCSVHHCGKAPSSAFENPRRGGDRLRGSSAIFADVDSLILVDRLSKEDDPEPVVELSFELRHGEPMHSMQVKRLRTGLITYDPRFKFRSGTGKGGNVRDRL